MVNKEKRKLNLIIGCGSLGANLALELSRQGKEVEIIDKNKNSFRKLGTGFGGLLREGDAADTEFLKKAEADKAETVIIVTDNDNTNIMTAQIMKEFFQTPKVIARLYDSERECVYREFGIETVCPEYLSAKEIEKLLSMENKK